METVTVDTIVVVRLLVKDDSAAFEKAKRLFSTHRVFIPDTVFMEAERFLRAVYAVPPAQIADAFRKLLRVGNVVVDGVQGSRQPAAEPLTEEPV